MESTWTTALDDFLNGLQRAPKTVRFYRVQLSQLARWASEEDIALPDFRARNMRSYLKWRAETQHVSAQTLEHDARCAKVFTRFLKREEYADVDALADYQVVRAPAASVPFPNAEEVAKLLTALQTKHDPKKNPNARYVDPDLRLFLRRRDYALVCLLVDTGARIGEICALSMGDLEFEDNRAQVTFRKTKGKTPRTVPIRASIGPLKEWIATRSRKQEQRDGDWLFYTSEGRPVDPLAFNRIFKRYVEYAGIRPISLHGIRHYALTIISNTDLKAAVAIAGHKDPKTTLRYARQDAEHVRSQHTQADPLGKAMVHKRSKEAAGRPRVV